MRRRLVAALVRRPLLVEGLREALEPLGDLRAFEVHDGESVGLLAALRPDAVIVDDEVAAEAALAYSRSAGVPALRVRLREHALELARGGRWEPQDGDLSPEGIRNLLAGELFGRARA